MNFSAVLRILGFLLLVFSLAMMPPSLIALLYGEAEWASFVNASAVLLVLGVLMWLPNRDTQQELTSRDGFVIVLLFWVTLSFCGTLPFLFSNALEIDFTNAFFESVSALTTTGATVISGLDELPKSLLFYRQMLQWFGGMGIIVLAVAVLPMLGIGGMQLFKAEAPGPNKDDKLTPRITETAKSLWYIYLSLTIVCAFAYWVAGMDLFDAVCHSFSTIAIGGMSPYDASIGHFDNPMIEWICIIFLVVSGVNFAMHFFAWQRKSIWHYLRDMETIFFVSLLIISVVLIWLALLSHNVSDDPFLSLRKSAFQVTSLLTTAGFTTTDISAWPFYIGFILICLSFIGACAGSTCGGMKSIRIILLIKQSFRELYQLIHPHGVFTVTLNKKPVDARIVQSIWAFAFVYVAVYLILTILLLITGLNFETAVSTAASSLNNLGPALGDASAHYADVNPVAKWLLCLGMIMGRLEVFTLLVLLTPMFWRK